MDIKALSKMAPWEWPEGAGRTFLGILRDKNAPSADRVQAATMAGDLVVVNDGTARTLLSVARDGGEPDELRGAAAIALGPVLEHADTFEFDDPDDVPISEQMFNEIQTSLRKLHMDAGAPADVRRLAFEASVRAPQDWHKAVISAMYSDTDELNVRSAVFAMRSIRGFDRQIIESLESRNPKIWPAAWRARPNTKRTGRN